MDILEIALIIIIATIINGLGTLLLLKLYLKRMNLQPYIRMAKQFASQMGMKSQAVQHEAKMKVMQKEAKAKVAHAAIESLPMGGILGRIIEKAGISPDEIFALLQDADFIKGIKVLLETFGGIKDKILGKEGTEKETSKSNMESQF